jgi:hypothetical protein
MFMPVHKHKSLQDVKIAASFKLQALSSLQLEAYSLQPYFNTSYAKRSIARHTTIRKNIRINALPRRMANRAPVNPPNALHAAIGSATA